MADDITYNHNVAEHRYEILLDGALAGVIDYRDNEGVLDLFHTGVEPQFGGRGLGSLLVAYALGDVAESGGKVRPSCPFIARYIDEHPDLRDLVA